MTSSLVATARTVRTVGRHGVMNHGPTCPLEALAFQVRPELAAHFAEQLKGLWGQATTVSLLAELLLQ